MPDPVDAFSWFAFLMLALGLPLLGWALMALDYRTYLLSLRRAMVVVQGYVLETPDWVRRDRPDCLVALGLQSPCTREEVLAAYRSRVKRLHPDRGGQRREFERLQRRFEEAMRLTETDAACDGAA